MGRYRYEALRELHDQQVRYAPLEKRWEQIDRAEELLLEIQPERVYPYQYVCYRITGFRPRSYADLRMTGADLRHDLRLLIEGVSGSLRLDAAAAGEPVLTIAELSRDLGVSTKTINRWREQGLVARRFVVDGRIRVGFLKSSVDRFRRCHEERMGRSVRFSQLSELEKEQIVERARRMAVASPKPTEIIRRIARKVGRSPETIRYTLRNHDQQNPGRAVFGTTGGPLRDPQKAAMYQAYVRGVSVDDLARRFLRTRSTIYRVINEMRAGQILAQKLEFIPNPLFEQPDAEEIILGSMPVGETPDVKPPKPPKLLPPYLASLYEVPLLSKGQEQYLFRKMNYLKYRAGKLRAGLDPTRARSSVLDEIEWLVRQAQAVKNQIIRANLRLVVSIAKRHIGVSKSFDELVSDGNMSLIRAVDKFDYARGNKFSTYASWAIMRNFARSIPQEHHQQDRYLTGLEELFETAPDPHSEGLLYESRVRQMRASIVKILKKLDQRERSIIISRYGLDGDGKPHTLEEVGNILGVTKERVRQLEVRAIGKLRQYANEEHVEPPDG